MSWGKKKASPRLLLEDRRHWQQMSPVLGDRWMGHAGCCHSFIFTSPVFPEGTCSPLEQSRCCGCPLGGRTTSAMAARGSPLQGVSAAGCEPCPVSFCRDTEDLSVICFKREGIWKSSVNIYGPVLGKCDGKNAIFSLFYLLLVSIRSMA